MKSRTILFLILLIVVFGIVLFLKKNDAISPAIEKPSDTVQGSGQAPVFVWQYEKDDSLNLDGLPQTNVFLKATYGSGAVERKLIDTTPGGCNDLPDAVSDSAPSSTVAQCYSAGLGYTFKVTKGEQSYLVQRKTFEEALPGDNLPVYEYEVVAEFPLSK